MRREHIIQLAELADKLDSEGKTESADLIDSILTGLEEPELADASVQKDATPSVVDEVLAELQQATAQYTEKVKLARAAIYRQLASNFDSKIDSKLRIISDAVQAMESLIS